MKKTSSLKGEKIIIPVKDTPKTARKIASELIPKWANEVDFVLPKIKANNLSVLSSNLYLYCRRNFHYANDPIGKELIRSPYQSWRDRKAGIDCEDFTIIIAACLVQYNYNPSLRIVDYGSGWQHIYVVVESIVIDPVSEIYNYEETYIRKMDFPIIESLGMSGLGNSRELFVKEIENKFLAKVKLNKLSIEKIAKSQFSIQDPREVKELTELAIVNIARAKAHQPNKSLSQKYSDLVDFYQSQVNLSLRTSTSVLLQQYSTPSPIAYLMGVYCEINTPKPNAIYLEPSAGNGLLTIAGFQYRFFVNELDSIRAENLKKQGFVKVSQSDASSPTFKNNYSTRFDAVITNPPFGSLEKREWVEFDHYLIKDLDHLMTIRALELMKSDGKAAIIIGGHTDWDELGRIKAGKNRIFINYLYNHYNVDDIILINGDLYSRMGTSFSIRLILINGKKEKPEGVAPLKNARQTEVVNTFAELYGRVMFNSSLPHPTSNNLISQKIKARARRIRILKLKYRYETSS